MRYHLLDLIHTELIDVGVKAGSDAEAIRAICEMLAREGYVEEAYADAVIRREGTYATGLPTSPVEVAIPHADPEHIHKTGVAIGVLERPIAFGQMGTDGSVKVNAQVVFVLAIKEQEYQTEMLQELVELLQSPAFLESVVRAENAADVLQAVEEALV